MPYAQRHGVDANGGALWTEEEILKAIDMKDRLKLQWPVIADRLGRSPTSLSSKVCRYRKGQLTFKTIKGRALYEEIAQEMIKGARLRDCSERFGIKRTTIVMGLASRGWDKETINEAREERMAA